MKKMNLFCLPFAGGTAAVFNSWKKFLDKHIDLKPIELSGRGKRIYEPLYQSVNDAVDDVLNIIKSDITSVPYAIFGHSLGGIIALELAYQIREKQLSSPFHLFISGRGAPNIPDDEEEIWHNLPDEQFKENILKLGGTPKEFFDHPELLEVILPMMRSDFKIAETYQFKGEVKPLHYPITVFVGKDEDVNALQMHTWREHTKKICSLHYYEGDHFFINDYTENIVEIVNYTMLNEYKRR